MNWIVCKPTASFEGIRTPFRSQLHLVNPSIALSSTIFLPKISTKQINFVYSGHFLELFSSLLCSNSGDHTAVRPGLTHACPYHCTRPFVCVLVTMSLCICAPCQSDILHVYSTMHSRSTEDSEIDLQTTHSLALECVSHSQTSTM